MRKKDQILLIGDASRLLGISPEAVRNHIRRGSLNDRRTPKGWRVFLFSEVELLKQKLLGEEGPENEG